MTKSEAEQQITKILEQLELSTGQLVEQILIHDIDITETQDEKKELLGRIDIRLYNIPGRRWSK